MRDSREQLAGSVLDPVLEVAVPLGRLSGYHEAAAAAVPTGKLYPLVGSKPVVRHDLALGRMRVAPTPQGVYINKPQLSLPMQLRGTKS
jgi:hypothetical protein